MTDKYVWLKLILENWKTLSPIFILLFSLIGVGFDNFQKGGTIAENEKTIYATRNQIAEIAKQYHKEIKFDKPEIRVEKIYIEQDCTKCEKLVNSLRREFHE